MRLRHTLLILILVLDCILSQAENSDVQFNRDIRPILAKNCFTCHGPDQEQRQAGLRLDDYRGATSTRNGQAAIIPNQPTASQLIIRIKTNDEQRRMPPAKYAAQLTAKQIGYLHQWIQEGANYDEHWSYVKPERPELPVVTDVNWCRNPIDYFVQSQLEQIGLKRVPVADRWSLARRVAIDLTGLPPTFEEAKKFVNDNRDDAYQYYVEVQLKKPSFGERWARVWLDLARYADSAGYADDPPRTIWAYRDYVISSFNQNKPFDQFTIEQIAGDLLPNPTEEQLVATAFHRNTMTNNEGGTSDEEFRNEAIVDRVNTTMTVWMGTTMGCAQCHSHKYDPISQEEYFQLFALFNNTLDSDKRDEQPTIKLFNDTQKQKRSEWKDKIKFLESILAKPTPMLEKAQIEWENRLRPPPQWQTLRPVTASAKQTQLEIEIDGSIAAKGILPQQDTYQLKFKTDMSKISALKLKVDSQDTNFVLSKFTATWKPEQSRPINARYVRLQLPGKNKILSLAEVEVWQGKTNLALQAVAKQSSTAYGGTANRANDGNTDGDYNQVESTTHTSQSDEPWWELDLGQTKQIDFVKIWNRTDGGENITNRLANYQLFLLDQNRSIVWKEENQQAPQPNTIHYPDGEKMLHFSLALADYEQEGFPAKSVLQYQADSQTGWAVADQLNQPHHLVLILESPLDTEAGQLVIELGQQSVYKHLLINRFSIQSTSASTVAEFAQIPKYIQPILSLPLTDRTTKQKEILSQYYRNVTPSLKTERDQLHKLKQKLTDLKPYTTSPIMQELAKEKRRETRIQLRGNFQQVADLVNARTPSVFHRFPMSEPVNRLGLAKWLVSRENPLTARVIANRYWEQLFGTGLVQTSEEFGTQGTLPSHPELLDWLAIELMDNNWDLKHLLRILVNSATYRQSSKVTSELLELDPKNHWLARGPRIRLSAEMIRDQALFVSGLLSPKMFGQPVNPPQPSMGIKAAFGSSIDWETSTGEDRYRRGIYTRWRRSNPYPSMVTFDAPDRRVCTVRRSRSNTPLQALVVLNDPVYVEAAQSLAQFLTVTKWELSDKIRLGIRQTLIRPAKDMEVQFLRELYQSAYQYYESNPKQAYLATTNPLNPNNLENNDDIETVSLAAWVIVCNTLLNLDEMFMKR